MFVVIYLVDLKKHIVVPQNFIFGLSQQNLNNYGKSKRKFLIFWSKEVCEYGLLTNTNDKPNFSLSINSSFPPAQNETCYIGQIKYFFTSFDDAKIYAEKFRAKEPVVYNPKSAKEPQPPIPQRSDFNHAEEIPHFETEHGNANRNNGAEREEEYLNAENHREEEEYVTIENNNEENEINASIALDDVKDPLQTLVLEESEIDVYDDLFNECVYTEQPVGESTRETTEKIVRISPGGTKRIIEIIDSDCEMSYECDIEAFKPADLGYQVKLEDPLSGNIPFKENLNKDRAYLITLNDNSHEIRIPAKAVEGLISLNQPGRRENEEKDKIFLKGLLISECTLKAIQRLQQNEIPPKQIINFIKDLFIHRLGDDIESSRYLAFKDLILVACEEIKKNSFK